MLRSHGFRRRSIPGALAAALAVGLLGTTAAQAQQSTLDPYKPYVRSYQAFSDPGATLRPGFPNPLGGSGRPTYGNVFDPSGMGYGGINPFGAPYFNQFMSPSLNRGASRFNRSVQELATRPDRLVDPQDRLDRDFYEQMQKRDDPYVRLQEKRDDYYFRALQEPDPRKRAELMKAYQRASQRSAAAFSSFRRSAGAPAIPSRRDLRSGAPAPSRRTPSANAPAAGDRPDSLKDALERSDTEDRLQGLPVPEPIVPPRSVRRGSGT